METVSPTINPRSPEPILHQALKIALDDEFHAREAYITVIETFGPQSPFTNIVEAEQRHQKALIALFKTYEVPLIENRWIDAIEAPKCLQEAYLMGVNAEIENIQMYDTLLSYTGNYPDVQEVFYRLQAASYNNHLPAFQSHLNTQEAQTPLPPTIQSMDKMNEHITQWSELVHKVANGEMGQEEMFKLLSGTNLSFIAGALLGAVGAGVLGAMTQKNEEETTKE